MGNESEPSAAAISFLNNKTKVAILKKYCDYLLESGKADSKKKCMEMVGPVISRMMDRGECPSTTMDVIENYINSPKLTDAIKARKNVDSLMRGCIVDSIESMSERDSMTFSEPEKALFSTYSQALTSMRTCEKEVDKFVGERLRSRILTFIGSYGKLLDSGFVAQFKK